MKKYLLFILLSKSLFTNAQISYYNFYNHKTAYSNEPTTQWKSTCQVINHNKEIILKKFSETTINTKYNKDEMVDSTYKVFYYSKDTLIKKKHGMVYYIKEQLDLDEVTTEEVESKILILDSMMYYYNKYEFEQYTKSKKQISSKFQVVKTTNTQANNITQLKKQLPVKKESENDNLSIAYFEKHILNSTIPSNSAVQTKYENGYRAIVWDIPLIKSYEYTNEIFDKLGYDIVKSDYKNTIAYRNCSKGILVEIHNCEFKQGLCITMQWLSANVGRQNKYFMFCK